MLENERDINIQIFLSELGKGMEIKGIGENEHSLFMQGTKKLWQLIVTDIRRKEPVCN